MKIIKLLAYIALLAIILFIQSLLNLSIHQTLIIFGIGLFIISEYIEKQNQSLQLIENKELQAVVSSSSKDVHLKHRQLLTVVSSIPWPILLLDQNGKIVMHNDVKAIIENDEMIDYKQNGLIKEVKEFVKDCFILETLRDSMINIKGIEYQVTSIPVFAKEKYSGCLIIFQDISKALEKEKMQKRFIADASHELKTPISVIKGMVEILNRDDFDDDIIRKEFLEQIEHEVMRIDVLVRDLLTLSRLSKSNIELDLNLVDINDLINEVVATLNHRAKQKQLSFKLDLIDNDMVLIDARKIEQVLYNLISNAITYSDQGSIEISTRIKYNQFYIMIKDHGIGIKEEEQSKIFERFYRVDSARSRSNGGSGLGLAIVKSIVDAHQGKIELESQLGQGSCFKVILPIKQ